MLQLKTLTKATLWVFCGALLSACGGKDEPQRFTVTASAGSGGSISPGTRSVQSGQTTSFTLSVNEGYSIASVTGCNGSLSGNTYTTGAITAACSISATFNLNSYTVLTNVLEGGIVAPEQMELTYGATGEFLIEAYEGYKFGSVDGCLGEYAEGIFTLAPLQSSCTLDVIFTPVIAEGAMLTKSLTGTAVVGRKYQNYIRYVLNDQRNSVVAMEISNPTQGGVLPEITPDGTVTWLPSDEDFAHTSFLTLSLTLAHGPLFTVELPVLIAQERLVLDVPLQKGEANYRDESGRYLISVKPEVAGKDISGSLRIVELVDKNSHYESEFWLDENSNAVLDVIDFPISSNFDNEFSVLQSVRPQSLYLNNSQQWASVSSSSKEYPLKEITDTSDISAPSSIGSLLDDSVNVYTSGFPIVYEAETPPNSGVGGFLSSETYYKTAKQRQVFSFLSSCSTKDECWDTPKTPVILIHGFVPEFRGLGGGEGTWGKLPNKLIQEGHPVFEMQWLTHMRFEEAAGALAEFTQTVARFTERKPTIMAHSFGGVVAHLAVQGQGIRFQAPTDGLSFNKEWIQVGSDMKDVVQNLITLSSPLSGISDKVVLNAPIDRTGRQMNFTRGRDTIDLTINGCAAITCMQAGAFDMNEIERASFANKVAQIDPALQAYPRENRIFTGESIVRLHDRVTEVPFLTVATFRIISNEIAFYPSNGFRVGDGLISLIGQAFSPSDFARTPYDSSNEFNFHFIETRGDFEALQNRKAGECSVLISDAGSGYKICARGAHTSTTKYARADYLIAKYDDTLEFTHPLKDIVEDEEWFPKVALGYINRYETRSEIRGAVYHMPESSKRYLVGMPVRVDIYNLSGVKLKTEIYRTDSTGKFNINLGEMLFSILRFGNRDELKGFEVEIKIGDGQNHRIYREKIDQIEFEHDLGEIDLTKDSQTLLDVSGQVFDADIQGTVAGATIWLEKGINLSAERLRMTANSRISKVVMSDAQGRFNLAAIEPGIYSILIDNEGFEPLLKGRVAINGSALSFSIRRAEIDETTLLNLIMVGQGSVTSSNGALSCTAGCTGHFAKGASVVLTATPAVGYQFVGWEGACTGSQSCVLSMTERKIVRAVFTEQAKNHTLSVTVNGSGAVTSLPVGINCPAANCNAAFTENTSVSLTAVPGQGSQFAGWQGACVGTGVCQLTMIAARQVTAEFLSPGLSVSPSAVDFGEIPVGEDSLKTITLTNTGGVTLTNISAQINTGQFTVSGIPGQLDAGQSVAAEVRFMPTSEQAVSAQLSISSAQFATHHIALTGKGLINDLLFRLIPSATELRTNDTLNLLVEITSGNPDYQIDINWGDGQASNGSSDGRNYTASHKYTQAGQWQLQVDITDKAGSVGSKSLTIKVADTVAMQTGWSAQARHIETDEFTPDVAIQAAATNLGNNTVQRYTTSWYPQAASNDEYFIKYRLPVPSGLISLTKKFRMTVVLEGSDISAYDRELAFVTNTGEVMASWIHEVIPPIPGYLQFKSFNGAVQRIDSGALNDDARIQPIRAYAVEWQGGNFTAQRYSGSDYIPLESLQQLPGQQLNEVQVTFKGNGNIYTVRLDYDLDGNGEYDDGFIIANTADLTVDWSVYKTDAPETGSGTGKLNDTGISWCVNGNTNNLDCPVAGFEGQDGEHGRDALARAGQLQKVGGGAAGFDFTKLDANGNDLPESASAWSCVRDNHTGLIWEVKTNDGGLRDMNHTYSWYNPDSNTNGGSAGTQNGGSCSGSDCDTHAFVQAVNSLGLCGANDWRMPTMLELMGIVHNGRVSPAIDTAYFSNTPNTWSNSFWSSSPHASLSNGAWNIGFFNGGVGGNNKRDDAYVQLVRVGQ